MQQRTQPLPAHLPAGGSDPTPNHGAGLAAVTLDDKYLLERGRAYLSGVQALVRLPMLQAVRDRAAGLNTGGFISGYRGSPLGGYDNELWKASRFLAPHNIHFQPGLNEDLAATSVWGTQQLHLFPGPLVDGVFGIWYGKGPGVDRSTDAFKHGNAAGSSRHGGVLLVAGDDHGCQSSTLPHQSEQVFAAAMIPVLNPASVQEYLDFGIYGLALSRFSGCWIGLKAVGETVESAASVHIDADRVHIVVPEFDMPAGGLNIRWPDPPLEQERRLHGPKMAAVAAFARANQIDRLVLASPAARLGILAAGKAYLDVRQALDQLGLDERGAEALGIRLYKPGLTWPLEPAGARRFAHGLAEILVVEEKRGFIEGQLAGILYHSQAADRPRLVGKRDEQGAVLLPSEGEISPALVARVIVSRLAGMGGVDPALRQRADRLAGFEHAGKTLRLAVERTPFFCSGCPHNTSTRVPEGSRAMAGIGCHGMVQQMPQRNTVTSTHMGGEGATWIGQSPFSAERHVFQNLGDGTYQHSGLLALRAAAVAGVNITYKILYNDAVAMTGGQSVDGSPDVAGIVRQVLAEGAKKVVVVAAEPGRHSAAGALPPGVELRGRDDLDRVQRELREIPGLTVLVYDQVCAAEKRRRGKRSAATSLAPRVAINAAVCEGCGDCSQQSNCVAVKPLETELGRKRSIDQSNCNSDLSCLKGFCPSFVTLDNARPRRLDAGSAGAAQAPFGDLPVPPATALERPRGILIAGIGGTGVLTVGAVLGMAAHIEGKGVTVLNFTGLSQKNGGVMSHVRIARSPTELNAVRLAAGGADLVLACDMVVAASEAALSRVEPGVTRAILNRDMQPTAGFVIDNALNLKAPQVEELLGKACGAHNIESIAASALAVALTGDAIAANLLLLGYAFQRGLVPLGQAAIERAIELNGVSVEAGKRAFALGRLAAHDRARLDSLVGSRLPMMPPAEPQDIGALVTRRAQLLAEYQDGAYAQRYRATLARVIDVERVRVGDGHALAEAVARNLYKLMAGKDEYEVARLHTGPAFAAELARQFEDGYRITFHLAIPGLARRDPDTGLPRKRAYGAWMLHGLRILARLKRLRGTRLDPFRHSAERRLERRLLGEYEVLVAELADHLTPANHAIAIELAGLPEEIRGYGHIRKDSAEQVKRREAGLIAAFRSADAPVALAA